MDILNEELNLIKLYQIFPEENNCISWCFDLGILPKLRNCDVCDSEKYILNRKERSKFGFFRCKNKLCLREFSRAKGTVFEYLHLDVRKIIFMIYLYCNDFKQYQVAKEIKLPG